MTIVQAWPYALLILIGGIILAYASLKWYDYCTNLPCSASVDVDGSVIPSVLA